jgi:hypothetical protein
MNVTRPAYEIAPGFIDLIKFEDNIIIIIIIIHIYH